MAGGKAGRKRPMRKRQLVKKKVQNTKKKRPQRKRAAKASGQGFMTGVAGSYGSMKMAVDASNATHIPSPIPLGPYTVVKGRSTLNITTNILGQTTVLLLGPHTLATIGSRDLTITPVLGVSGLGTNVPGTTETLYSDAIIAPYAATLGGNLANGGLHGITAVINCLSTATQAEGQIYFGSLNQRINRGRFATWNDVAVSLINRREVHPHSAYNVLSTPIKMSAYPVDVVDWARQSPVVLASGTTGDNVTMDSLSQMVIVFPATTVAINYTITLYTEWRVNFVDAALASTAVSHGATPLTFWSNIAALGNQTAGFIGRAETIMESGMNLAGALRGASSTFSKAGMALGLL